MTLQRRLLILLLIGVPLIWGVSLVATIFHAREEIYELFDTEEVRLAQQVMAVLPLAGNGAPVASLHGDRGEADLETLAISVWIDGQRVAADREGGAIPYQPNAAGFTMPHLDGKRWRIYYLPSADGRRLVAVGQLMAERRTLLGGLIASQLIPWLLSLPLLLIAMTWAVRHALRPVRELAQQLEARRADDLSPLDDRAVPSELRPLIVSTNRLFAACNSCSNRSAGLLPTPRMNCALRSQRCARNGMQSDSPRTTPRVVMRSSGSASVWSASRVSLSNC